MTLWLPVQTVLGRPAPSDNSLECSGRLSSFVETSSPARLAGPCRHPPRCPLSLAEVCLVSLCHLLSARAPGSQRAGRPCSHQPRRCHGQRLPHDPPQVLSLRPPSTLGGRSGGQLVSLGCHGRASHFSSLGRWLHMALHQHSPEIRLANHRSRVYWIKMTARLIG